jgi:WD40 repeat protein
MFGLFKSKKHNKKEKFLIFEEKEEIEILKTICILKPIYLLAGKSNGILSIYKIYDNTKIINKKIHEKSITILMPYEEKQLCFFSCSEEPTIKLLELKDCGLMGFKLITTKEIIRHQSCVKKMEYLGNNFFASCSMDNSFVIWNLINSEEKLKIYDSVGIENFFIDMNNRTNGSFKNLITLNNKKILSLYTNLKEKAFLKKFIVGIDYTNNNSMMKIKDKLFIGGYKYLQVISAKNLEFETLIKLENPISYIYDSQNKFIVLGLKNGKLLFLNKKTKKQLDLENLKKIEESNFEDNINNKKKFKFSNLSNNNEIKLYEDECIIYFNIYNEILFCISDETLKVYKQEIESEIKKVKKENEVTKNQNNKWCFLPLMNFKECISICPKDIFNEEDDILYID